MAAIKSEYYRFNGTSWDLIYFKTSADIIVETANYKVLTAAERTKISNYLTNFNSPNKLALIDSVGKLPDNIIPALPYLPLNGGMITGNLTVDGESIFVGDSQFNSIITDKIKTNIGSDTISFEGATNITFDGAQLKDIALPSIGSDAANKEYVDNLVSAGFKVKDPVKAASTGNVSISTALNALDGYTLAAGDRILLKNQTTASQNGVYKLSSNKIPEKIVADSALGTAVFVEHGDTQNDYIFVQSEENQWHVFSKPDTIKAGNGLSKSGTTLNIANDGVTNRMLAGSINWFKLDDQNHTDTYGWAAIVDADTNTNLPTRISQILSAIKRLRGTEKYNTYNTETIAGAYQLANSKIKSEMGTTMPGTTGFTTGDLYFKIL